MAHINPGMDVTFARPPSCFADRTGHRFTVETVSYNVGGMMSRADRDAIASGAAHIVMVDHIGRRVGTTSDRIDVSAVAA